MSESLTCELFPTHNNIIVNTNKEVLDDCYIYEECRLT